MLLRFERGPDGRRIRQWFGGGEGPSFEELPSLEPMPSGYAGTYRSEELAASFVVASGGETLQVRAGGQTLTLRRIRNDVFIGAGITLRFEAPREGKSAGFSLDQGRVRGIRFTRTAD